MKARIQVQRNYVMSKLFLALPGILLASYVPTAAQPPPPQLVLAQVRAASAMMPPTVSTALLAGPTVLSPDTGKSPVRFNRLFVRAYASDPSLRQLIPMERVRNLLFTQVNLPLVQLWSGRLHLDAFQRSLRIQDVQLGLSDNGGTQAFRSARQTYYSGPNSARVSGLSLTFHFGGDARSPRATEALRNLTKIVGNVLN